MELSIETRTKNEAYIIGVQKWTYILRRLCAKYILKIHQQRPPILIIDLSRVNYGIVLGS